MKFIELKVCGAYLIEIEPIKDDRGFLARGFCRKEIKEKIGIEFEVYQANIPYNIKKGTIRGMHYQKSPYEEMKLIACVKGSVFDVVLDLRKDSATYLQWEGYELTENNYKMLLIPKGCAHGLQTLEDNTVLNYKASQYYVPEANTGVRYNDKAFNIDWPIKENLIISEKDKNFPDYTI